MGHSRLGEIPKSRKWRAVVAALAGGRGAAGRMAPAQDVGIISRKALGAARAGLDRAVNDPGLRYTFYTLTQLVLAAREENWQERLATVGIRMGEDATPFDLAAQVQGAIDGYVSMHGRPTDVSEMAQQAAGTAIVDLAGESATTLFGGGQDELQRAVRGLSTKRGFAQLGQRFFGDFVARFLNFYLSRVTAGQVGGRRLQQLGDLSAFNEALETHCQQGARIVRDFCGEWYSKTEFKEGIDLENTSRFLAVALRKVRDELARWGTET